MKNPSLYSLVIDHLAKDLHAPVEYALFQPGKKLRSQLVHLGAMLSTAESLTPEMKRRCELAASMIEKIHAGSLIIDDIEDNTAVRRGAPSVFRKFGLPLALNAGNWLYFDPLNTIPDMGLPAEEERQLFRECVRTLSQAHCGQALDLGTAIDLVPQNEVPTLCLSVLDWKTGELTALALQLGGFAAGASEETKRKLRNLGRSLGIGLQMLDDVANFTLDSQGAMAEKKYEDLKLRRPSWLWCFLATHLNAANYEEWRRVVQALPDVEPLEDFSRRHWINACAQGAAENHLGQLLKSLAKDFPEQRAGREKVEEFVRNMESLYAQKNAQN